MDRSTLKVSAVASVAILSESKTVSTRHIFSTRSRSPRGAEAKPHPLQTRRISRSSPDRMHLISASGSTERSTSA